MTGIKVSTVRFDGAQEFGKSLSFQAFCRERGIVMDPVAEYTHVQNSRSEMLFGSLRNTSAVFCVLAMYPAIFGRMH